MEESEVFLLSILLYSASLLCWILAGCFFIFIFKTFSQDISKWGVFSHSLPRILWSPFSLYSRCEMFSLVTALISHVCSNYPHFFRNTYDSKIAPLPWSLSLSSFSLLCLSSALWRELLEFGFTASSINFNLMIFL